MTSQHHHAASGLVGGALTKVADSLRYLSDLLARIVNGIKGIAPMLATVACSSADATEPYVAPPKVAAAPAVVAPAPAIVREEPPRPIGDFSITFYYVVTEDEVVPVKKPAPVVANDNQIDKSDPELASVVVQDQVTILRVELRADRGGLA
jgi:hypothetical protein